MGVDWEIRQCNEKDKGLGIFALRDFAVNENLMVERCLLRYKKSDPMSGLSRRISGFTKGEINEFYSLSVAPHFLEVAKLDEAGNPQDPMAYFCGTLQTNALSDGEGYTIICLNMSRINHSCAGNTGHWYDRIHDCKRIITIAPIKRSEEITISYCKEWLSKKDRQQNSISNMVSHAIVWPVERRCS
jgi:hypothetical protein